MPVIYTMRSAARRKQKMCHHMSELQKVDSVYTKKCVVSPAQAFVFALPMRPALADA